MAGVVQEGMVGLYFNLDHSLKNVVISPNTDEIFTSQFVQQYIVNRCKRFHVTQCNLNSQTLDSKLVISFNTIDQGDQSFQEIRSHFSSQEHISVYHPADNFLFPPPMEMLSRVLILENIPDFVTDGDLAAQFPEASNVSSFHESTGLFGVAVLVMPTENAANHFAHAKKNNLMIHDTQISIYRYLDWTTLKRIKDKEHRLDDGERVQFCEMIYASREEMQGIMSTDEAFGGGKIRECLKMYQQIEDVMVKVNGDTRRRYKKQIHFPEREDINALFIKMAFISPPSKLQPNLFQKCKACGMNFHVVQDCPLEAPAVCLLCGKEDHTSNKCSMLGGDEKQSMDFNLQRDYKIPQRAKQLVSSNERISIKKGSQQFNASSERQRIQDMMNEKIKTRMTSDIQPLLGPDEIANPITARMKIQEMMNTKLNERDMTDGHVKPLIDSTQEENIQKARLKIQELMNSKLDEREYGHVKPLMDLSKEDDYNPADARAKIQAMMNEKMSQKKKFYDRDDGNNLKGNIGQQGDIGFEQLPGMGSGAIGGSLGPSSLMSLEGELQSLMGGPQSLMGGPQSLMRGPQSLMGGGPQSLMGGPQSLMGGPQPLLGEAPSSFSSQHQENVLSLMGSVSNNLQRMVQLSGGSIDQGKELAELERQMQMKKAKLAKLRELEEVERSIGDMESKILSKLASDGTGFSADQLRERIQQNVNSHLGPPQMGMNAVKPLPAQFGSGSQQQMGMDVNEPRPVQSAKRKELEEVTKSIGDIESQIYSKLGAGGTGFSSDELRQRIQETLNSRLNQRQMGMEDNKPPPPWGMASQDEEQRGKAPWMKEEVSKPPWVDHGRAMAEFRSAGSGNGASFGANSGNGFGMNRGGAEPMGVPALLNPRQESNNRASFGANNRSGFGNNRGGAEPLGVPALLNPRQESHNRASFGANNRNEFGNNRGGAESMGVPGLFNSGQESSLMNSRPDSYSQLRQNVAGPMRGNNPNAGGPMGKRFGSTEPYDVSGGRQSSIGSRAALLSEFLDSDMDKQLLGNQPYPRSIPPPRGYQPPGNNFYGSGFGEY